MKLKKIAAILTAAVMAFTAVATPLCDNIPTLERGLSASAYYSVKDSFYPVALTGDGANDMINVAVAQAGRKDDDIGWYPSGEAWCADFVLDVARVAGQTAAVPDSPANAACGTFKQALLAVGAHEVTVAQAGDLVFYCGTDNNVTYHVGIMKNSRYSVEGNAFFNGVYQVVANRDTTVFSTDGRSIAEGTIKRVFIRPNYPNSTVDPSITTGYITKEQGAQWALDRVGKSIDVDGYYGAQCKDFVEKFTTENFGVSFPGNAIDLITCSIPSGWVRIKNTPEFLPQPGDIALWAYGTYGHTGIIVSANLNTFVSVDQNWYNASSNGSPAAKVTHNYTTYNFWGVLRPPYSQNPVNEEKWKVNVSEGVNVRSGPGTNYGIVNAYSNGTVVSITAKASGGGYTWGKCSEGWLVLDFCRYLSGSLQHTHSYGAWYDKTKPTCTSAGVQEQKCSCGATKTRETAALGHSWGGWATATKPTCTAQGVEQRTCSRCSKAETRYITALGHNYSSEWTIDKQATCSAEGSKSRHCTRCDAKTEVTAIAKIAHTYTSKVVKPTLTQQGYTLHTCSVCGYSYKDNYTAVRENPSKVTGLAFGARSADYVSLKWNKDANADGYIVEYLSGNRFVKLTDKTSGLAVSYKVTGLEAGTLYKFRVRGYKNENGKRVYGEYSDVLNVRTLPKAMSNLKLGARTDNSISLKWDKNETANGAVVEMYKNGQWVVVATKTSNKAVSHKITGLKAGTQYKFRVRAYINDEGGRIYSVYNVTLNEVTAPAAVTNFRSVISAKTAIRFNWNKNTAVDGYEIDMAVGSNWVKQATVEGGNSVAYAQTKLAPDTAYRFRIRAYKTVDGKKIYSAYTTANASTAK